MKTIFVNTIAKNTGDSGLNAQLKRVHTNTGNLIWHEKCRKEIRYSNEVYIDDLQNSVKNSVLVIPVSNNISIYETEFSKKFYKLAKQDAQITLVGLGAQCVGELNTPRKLVKELPDKKIRLFKTYADKTNTIGVRGWFTAECLDRMGIHNYRVIGCPSFYSNSLTNIRNIIPTRKLKKVCLNFTGGKKAEHSLLELAFKSGIDSRVIMQGIQDLPQIVYNGMKLNDNLLNKSFPQIKLSSEDVCSFWQNNSKIFWEIDEWEKYLQEEKFTFCVGSRLHGNMICFLNNIPALWIVHDCRTREITELLKIPHIDVKALRKIKYMEQLAEICEYTDDFYKNFKIMRKSYIKFLEENNIEHNFL